MVIGSPVKVLVAVGGIGAGFGAVRYFDPKAPKAAYALAMLAGFVTARVATNLMERAMLPSPSNP